MEATIEKERPMSFTRMSKFIQCPALYKYIYIDKGERPDSIALDYGRKVHALLKLFCRQVMLDANGLKQEPDPAQVDEWYDSVGMELGLKEHVLEKWRLRKVAEFLIDKDFGIADIEKKIETEINGKKITGIIDLLCFTQDGEMLIIDWKTVKQTIDADEIDGDLQLSIYAWLVSQEYKNVPELRIKKGLWFWRYGGHTFVPWDKTDFEETIRSNMEKIAAETVFDPRINQFCKWCPLLFNCKVKDEVAGNASYGQCKNRAKLWEGKAKAIRPEVEEKLNNIEEDYYIEDNYRYKISEKTNKEYDMDALFNNYAIDPKQLIENIKDLEKIVTGSPIETAFREHAELIKETLQVAMEETEKLKKILKPVKKCADAEGIDLPIANEKKVPVLSYKELK